MNMNKNTDRISDSLPPESLNFLKYFPNHFIQTFDDKKGRMQKGLTHCKPAKDFKISDLYNLNNLGAGVFFTPNQFKKQRRKENCVGVNAWFVEIDDVSKEEQWGRLFGSPLIPSLIVESANSYHAYWLAKGGTIENHRQIVINLIEFFGGDHACKDINRVLRIPGFYHNKKEPYLVKLVHETPERTYSEAEMLEAFPTASKEMKDVSPLQKKAGDPFWDAAASFDNKVVLQRLSGTSIVNGEVFSYRERSGGGEYIDVNGLAADAWLDERGMIGSGQKGGPTYIQWLEYYGHSKGDIAKWIKEHCSDLMPPDIELSFNKKSSDEQQGTSKSRRSNGAKRLMGILESAGITFFHDETQEAFAVIPVSGHNEVIKCSSNRFKSYLSKLAYDHESEVLSKDALNCCLSLIEAKAIFEGECFPLKIRVASHGDDIWYDLTDKNWNVVRISKNGWEVTSCAKPIFQRYRHQQAQVVPDKSGDLHDIKEFVNISDKKQMCLFLVSIVASFIEDMDHPIFVFYGEKGASKSSLMTLLRTLIDPSIAGLLTIPGRSEDLIQIMSHNWCPFFDNVSYLSLEVSDIMCKTSTGGAFSKRALYTNDEDHIQTFRRVQGINGISLVASKSDLLDRSLLFELKRIKSKDRLPKKKLLEAFNEKLPFLLGGVFNALSKAMDLYDSIQTDELYRMADFTKWGIAIANALGYTQKEFVDAYEANISLQNEQSIHENPVALALIEFINKEKQWQGTASELKKELEDVAFQEQIETRSKYWPKAPNVLVRRLNEVLSNLEAGGVHMRFERPDAKRKLIILEKQSSQPSEPTRSESPNQREISLKEEELPF